MLIGKILTNFLTVAMLRTEYLLQATCNENILPSHVASLGKPTKQLEDIL